MMVDPRIWPDAKSFIPERWIEPYKGIEADKKAFIPFSAGSRNCPGQQYVGSSADLSVYKLNRPRRFALKNLRLTLAMLLHRYELTLIPGQSHEMRVHTTPVSFYYRHRSSDSSGWPQPALSPYKNSDQLSYR